MKIKFLTFLFLMLLLGMGLGMIGYAQEDGEYGRGPDGHYHDPVTGVAQPDMCDGQEKTHPCRCARMDEKENPSCNLSKAPEPGNRCQTYCRTDACKCKPLCCEHES